MVEQPKIKAGGYSAIIEQSRAFLHEVIFRGLRSLHEEDIYPLDEIISLAKKTGFRKLLRYANPLKTALGAGVHQRKNRQIFSILIEFAIAVELISYELLHPVSQNDLHHRIVGGYLKNREKTRVSGLHLLPLAAGDSLHYVLCPDSGQVYTINSKYFNNRFDPASMVTVTRGFSWNNQLKIVRCKYGSSPYRSRDYIPFAMNPEEWLKLFKSRGLSIESPHFRQSSRAFLFHVKKCFSRDRGLSLMINDSFIVHLPGSGVWPFSNEENFLITGSLSLNERGVCLTPYFVLSEKGFQVVTPETRHYFTLNPFERCEDIFINGVFNGLGNCPSFLSEKLQSSRSLPGVDFQEIHEQIELFLKEEEVSLKYRRFLAINHLFRQVWLQWQLHSYFPNNTISD